MSNKCIHQRAGCRGGSLVTTLEVPTSVAIRSVQRTVQRTVLRSLYVLAFIALNLHVSGVVLPAQAQVLGGEQERSIEGQLGLATRQKELMKGNGSHAAIDRDGRDLNLGGFERSPIIFDPLGNDERKRVFPQMSAQESYTRKKTYQPICKNQSYFPPQMADICNENNDDEADQNGLVFEKTTNIFTAANLMVDDEIHKSEMGLFWDPTNMKEAYLENQKAADRMTENIKRPLAIHQMALSFLDKSISSAMATAESAADQNTMLQYIRQINLNTSQLANPDRVQVLRDYNEKVEACMWAEGDQSKLSEANGKNGKPMFAHVNLMLSEKWGGKNCMDSGSYCRERYEDKDGQVKSVLYQFCTCCGDLAVEMNDSTVNKIDSSGGGSGVTEPYRKNLCEEYVTRMQSQYGKYGYQNDAKSSGNDLPKKTYSLVERVFMGLDYSGANGGAGGGGLSNDSKDVRTTINNFMHYFQDLYGDVCMFETKEGFIRKQYVQPFWSVPQMVDMFRNGRPDDCDRATFYCPISAEQVGVGICPAMKMLLAMEIKGDVHKIMTGQSSEIGMSKEDLESYWVQATLGDSMTARDLQNIVASYKDSPDFNLFVEALCDTSATVAVKKLHLRMTSIAIDHMLLNQRISDEDRRIVRRLMDRLAEYLRLAGEDSASMVDPMLIASEIRRERLDQASRNSFVASSLGSSANSSRLDELDNTFGGAGPTSAVAAQNP